ncbi:hypothetical protein DITRI_Ditri10aG0140400 [Diplodiscus trichospermus]
MYEEAVELTHQELCLRVLQSFDNPLLCYQIGGSLPMSILPTKSETHIQDSKAEYRSQAVGRNSPDRHRDLGTR